jgi:hypothetical protein
MLKEFDPRRHDAAEFDRVTLNYLAKRYRATLHDVRDWIDSRNGIPDSQRRAVLLRTIDWDTVAFHLILACAGADALGVRRNRVMWRSYAKGRIIPLLFLNQVVEDQAPGDATGAEYALANAEIWEGIGIGLSAGHVRFWEAQLFSLTRMATAVFADLRSRFDRSLLRALTPHQRRRMARAAALRSAVLEMPLLGLLAHHGVQLHSLRWIRRYEELRQGFDDLMDIESDVRHGRLTEPVFRATAHPAYGRRVAGMIDRIWSGPPLSRDKRIVPETGRLTRELTSLHVIGDSVRRLQRLARSVSRDASREAFPGNAGPILAMIEVKSSAIHRFAVNGFKGVRPEYALY